MSNTIGRLTFSIIWLIFGIALVVYTWDWFTKIAEFQGDDVFLAIYWGGYAVIVGVTCIIAPIWIIATTMMKRGED